MSRLWDKGAPLDQRVLQYTAGEDYALDERLVPYDVRASIAHAQMLRDQQLLTAGRLRGDLRGTDRDRRRARPRRVAHRAGGRGWPDGAGTAADGAHRRRRRPHPPRPLTQRPGADRAAPVPARRHRRARRGGAARCGRAGRPGRAPGQHRAARLHAHAAGHAQLGGAVGRRLTPPKSATMRAASRACCGACRRTRWARPPAMARRACRWIARPPRRRWAST